MYVCRAERLVSVWPKSGDTHPEIEASDGEGTLAAVDQQTDKCGDFRFQAGGLFFSSCAVYGKPDFF